jgi:kinesin family member 11
MFIDNEELQDLLNISGDKKLKLCEDVKKGVICQNLEEITVLTVNDIFEILQRGIQQRQTAATLCNKNSSRSHSIFTMKIMIKETNVEGEEVIRHGQLNLVDLAGYVQYCRRLNDLLFIRVNCSLSIHALNSSILTLFFFAE